MEWNPVKALRKRRETRIQQAVREEMNTARVAKRRFDAAKQVGFLSTWTQQYFQTFDQEIRFDLVALRTRSRELSLNNVYFVRYLRALTDNVVGPNGISLKMTARGRDGSPDVVANRVIEESWKHFSRNITTDGLSLKELLELLIQTVARDGEVFVRVLKGKSVDPVFAMKLQVWQSDYVDHFYNEELDNGHVVRSSVEYDKKGTVVAYYFFKEYPIKLGLRTGIIPTNSARVRVPADQVFHLYRKERPIQSRGYPWLSAAMLDIKQLVEYIKTELVAARVGASKMGFFTRKGGDNELADGYNEEQEDGSYQPVQEVVPGAFDMLPPGWSLETFDPNNPNSNFNSFIKAIIRGIAASLGVSYHTLSNDLESTSYSSLRQGAIDERDTWKSHQQFLIEKFLLPLFEMWLAQVLLLGLDGVKLPYRAFNKLNKPTFRPRTWDWVDPAKEAAALQMQLQNGLRSRTDIARSLGRDFRDVLAEISEENAEMEKLGIRLPANQDAESETRALTEEVTED